MRNRFISLLIAGFVLLAGAAQAQDPPAVAAVAAGQKDALRALIAAARTEGAIAYWDAVVSPETNDELTAKFRAFYGLPANFAVKYTLSATLNLVTRVEQEVGSGNVTIDVASLASPPWINGLVAAGHVMKYDSPEHVHYARAIAAGMGKAGYFVPNGAYCFVPAWNTETLDFKGTSWKDVLGAVPPGRISTNDAPNSATGLLSYMGLRQNLGIDFFHELAKMQLTTLHRAVRTNRRGAGDRPGPDGVRRLPGPVAAIERKGREAEILVAEGGHRAARCRHVHSGEGTASEIAAKLWIDFHAIGSGADDPVAPGGPMDLRPLQGFKKPAAGIRAGDSTT